MCYSPVHIKNKSKYFNPHSMFRSYLDVPCGKCFQCRQRKQNDYLVRASYEYEDTKKFFGGFTFFETLTYNNENLPTFHGMPCFSKDDYRKFMKRLRKRLFDNGYQVENNLHYFFTCEYGGIKHRPHYHVLFFSKIPNLSPYTFKQFINLSWQKGFTDSIFNTEKRLVTHDGAIRYVSKYVTKDIDFVDTYNKKIKELELLIDEAILNYHSSEEIENLTNMYLSLTDKNNNKTFFPFHSQSKNFGSTFRQYNDIELLENEQVVINTRNGKQLFPMPDYYKRKLFYELYTNHELLDPDTLEPLQYWRLTPTGIDHKIKFINKQIQKLAENYETTFINLQTNDSWTASEVTNLLGSRSWTDVACYSLVYRGSFHIPNTFTPDLYATIDLRSRYYKPSDMIVNTSSFPYQLLRFLPYTQRNKYKNLSDELLKEKFIINEKSYKMFEGFDRILALFDSISRTVSQGKQRREEGKQRLKSRIKFIL